MAKAFLTKAKEPLEDKGFTTLNPADQPDSPTGRQVTWVGHSTLLVSINGQHILTDPIFVGRASPFSFMGPKRAGKTPLAITKLPPIDAVIISHNHYDHLSIPSLKALNELQPAIQYFVPLGLTDLLKKAGIIQITELDWWQSASHNNIEFTATPVHHWSSRRGFDRNETLWSGWMVKWPEFSFYFAGDTGYSSDFRETRFLALQHGQKLHLEEALDADIKQCVSRWLPQNPSFGEIFADISSLPQSTYGTARPHQIEEPARFVPYHQRCRGSGNPLFPCLPVSVSLPIHTPVFTTHQSSNQKFVKTSVTQTEMLLEIKG